MLLGQCPCGDRLLLKRRSQCAGIAARCVPLLQHLLRTLRLLIRWYIGTWNVCDVEESGSDAAARGKEP